MRLQLLSEMKSYQDRLLQCIPGGSHTYSRGFDQFPSNAPPILERGKGAYVWDAEGHKFLDYGMALRAVTLGYSDHDINQAAFKQIENGNNLTKPSLIELEAAENLIDLIPSVEMVKFAKNGSNVTTAALKLARSFTGKKYICIPRQQPFFSFDDWFIGTTPITKGIPNEHFANTLLFDYGNISSLEQLFRNYPEQIAAVMLEPSTSVTPCPISCDSELSYLSPCRNCHNTKDNFLLRVQELCNKKHSLFILDEMITGFRWDIKGAQHFFGVTPDLTTFGKAMANGFSLSALAGRKDVMQCGSIEHIGQERTFLLSSTHGAEMCSLGAFMSTLTKYKNLNVCEHLWDFGEQLRAVLTDAATEAGIRQHFSIDGPSICMTYGLLDAESIPSLGLKTLFQQELVKNNVLMPWISPSLSHGQKEIELTYTASLSAFRVVLQALETSIDQFLEGNPIKPVFRRYN